MFKIGEFSRMAQVSVHLLRHYDEIGLLPPAEVDPDTSYRYYSAQQLPRLNRIIALRDMGLSLEQVADVVDGGASPQEIRSMFALRRAQLERSIDEDLATLRSIEARLERIDDGEWEIEFDVQIKALPAQPILGVRRSYVDFGVAARAMGDMMASVRRAGVADRLGEVVAVMHNEALEDAGHDLEIGLMAPDWSDDDGAVVLSDGTPLELRVLPAIDAVASAVRVGMPTSAHVCRADLALWVERNGYVLDGHGREVFIMPPRPGHEDETVMEIQVPIVAARAPT